MNDSDFDALARRALEYDTVPSEAVWQKVRKREPRWMPSFAEIGFAAVVGVVVLLAMTVRVAPSPPVLVRSATDRPSVARTYVAVTRATLP